MEREQRIKAELCHDCQQSLDQIIEQCQHLKILVSTPQKNQCVNWEYVGILVKAKEDLATLMKLLQKVVKIDCGIT